jgi:hypothetical protein
MKSDCDRYANQSIELGKASTPFQPAMEGFGHNWKHHMDEETDM